MRANQIRFRATAFLEFHCPKETSTYATTDLVIIINPPDYASTSLSITLTN